jgi:peptidoglycan pentaglycine glycine transferase (the first glycine)
MVGMEDSATASWRFSTDDDPEWDAYVAATPGGHHTQTSRWARVKAVVGWRAARVVLHREGTITSGAQLLIRDVPHLGPIAYAPRTPLTVARDERTLLAALDAIDALARREGVRYLKLQPPCDRHDAAAVIERHGFAASSMGAGPTATVRVSLDRDPDALLAAMRPTARRNIRQAQRRGVMVRSGSGADLDAFIAVVDETSRRQRFNPYPAAYYREIWNQFGADGHAHLLLGECDGQVLAAVLVIGWGDTALYKMGGWTGQRRDLRPNELMHWHGVQWARDRGYAFYDLEGIRADVARQVLAGAQPEEPRRGTDHFKLGLGGDVTIFPGAFDVGYGRMTSRVVRAMGPRADRWWPLANRLVGRGS